MYYRLFSVSKPLQGHPPHVTTSPGPPSVISLQLQSYKQRENNMNFLLLFIISDMDIDYIRYG